MSELIAVLDLPTTYTSGAYSPAGLSRLAAEYGIDVIITADHNLLVQGVDGYTQHNGRTALLLAAQQLYDRTSQPARGRLMIVGAPHDLTPHAAKTRQLIQLAQNQDAMVFALHPFAATKTALGHLLPPWEAGAIPQDIHGIEIWNSLSELQARAPNRILARLLSWLPSLGLRGPDPQAIRYWDEQHAAGATCTAIAGSGLPDWVKPGSPLERMLFTGVSNHLIVPRPLTGTLQDDRSMILEALRLGHSFIARDDLAPASGFRFYAQGREENGEIGDSLILKDSVTFQIRLPQAATCLLFQNGEVIRSWAGKQICVHTSTQPGAYRVEARLPHLAQEAAWIVSNPIYVRPYIAPPLRDQLYDRS